jgi:hypothetical protein
MHSLAEFKLTACRRLCFLIWRGRISSINNSVTVFMSDLLLRCVKNTCVIEQNKINKFVAILKLTNSRFRNFLGRIETRYHSRRTLPSKLEIESNVGNFQYFVNLHKELMRVKFSALMYSSFRRRLAYRWNQA